MARARPLHSGHRAVTDLTLGVVKAVKASDRRRLTQGLAETDQQYQFPITGHAEELPAFTTVSITFDFPFYYAPSQRDSDLERPHVGWGAECDAFVMLSVHVSDWVTDEDTGATIGATVAIGVSAQGSDVAFSGKIHITFQGFSAPDEVDGASGET